MKLKNIFTNEIVVFGEGVVDLNKIGCKNVAEMLAAGWEDYEDPKGIWYVGELGEPLFADHLCDYDTKHLKKIGNYFRAKKDAEKAIEKLKAWKRLKDKGFRIALRGCKGNAWLEANWGNLKGDYSDVKLLFGDEE